MKKRAIQPDPFDDLQNALLFPVCKNVEELGLVMRWMVSERELENGRKIWESSPKMSANELSDRANLIRLLSQRERFRQANWPMLAANHEESVFYQLDLADAASEFAADRIVLPTPLSSDAPLMKQIHNRMFRARVLQLEGKPYEGEQQEAFSLLREGLIGSVSGEKQSPFLNVYRD